MTTSRTLLPLLAACSLGLTGCPPLEETDGGTRADAGVPTSDAGDPILTDAGDPDAGEPGLLIARVATESGDVVGEIGEALNVFRGLPYAAPPVGELRWRGPEPALPFASGELDATEFGAVCPQGSGEDRRGDEDCLTLNVWAPRAEGRRAVMVFIHGGSFVSGTGSGEIFEGSRLALAGDVVVVTINYRLGALGFLATDSLADESADGSVGNYGIRDQIAALEWVQRNIAGFGGDADRVTVFGESAGSISICALLGAPAADGLYAGAVMQSGGGCFGFTGPNDTSLPPSRNARGRGVLDALGCDGANELACARGASADAVLDALPVEPSELSTRLYAAMVWGPTIDGVLIEQDPGARAARGETPDVPVIIGINHDEALLFTLGESIHVFNYRRKLAELAGEEHADALVALYPIADYGSARVAFSAAATDLVLGCDVERYAAERTAAGSATHVYEFTQTLGGIGALLGSAHALELPYLFGNFGGYTPRAEDLALSAAMQRAWTSFARDGVPQLDPAWDPHRRGEATVATLDAPVTVGATWREGKCDALRDLGLVE